MNTGADVTGKKVLVALTGRVDSCVAAFLLKKQGMQVHGLAIVTSNHDITEKKEHLPKCHVMDLERIRRFCESIGIPFYATDAKSIYEGVVIDTLIANKLTGRANATCFNCTHMRMQVMYQKMKELKFDYMATGHYAKVHKNLNSNKYFIHSNNDVESDQSYLLAGLSNEILSHLILPLGELKKPDVEKIARSFGLDVDPSCKQKGFCFRTTDSMKRIIQQKIPKSMIRSGIVMNKETDSNTGDHNGMVYHFISEKNLQFAGTSQLDKNLEIINYDYAKAIIELGYDEHLRYKGTSVVHLKISEGVERSRPISCYAKFKYSSDFIGASLFFKNNESAYIEFEAPVYPLIKGEMLVLYDGNGRNAKAIGLGKVGQRGLFELVDRAGEYRKKSVSKGDEQGPEEVVKMFKF